MSFRRFAAARGKRDANHRDIVEALTRAGCSVMDTGGVGHGFPDVVVGVRGMTYLLEIKREWGKAGVTRTARATRERQEAFRASWRGHPVQVVTSPESALRAVGVLKSASEDRAGMANVEPSEF